MATDGCAFEDLCKGTKKDYVCDASYLVELKKDESVNDQVKNLTDKVKKIFDDIKKEGKEVEEFYIGKTYVPKKRNVVFNRTEPGTWRKKGIKSRWDYYNSMGYDGLIVLTVVTKEVLPHDDAHQEDYALMLEQRLLHYYKFENYDDRIENETFGEGKTTNTTYKGYAVYIAVKLKEFELSDLFEIPDSL